VSGKAALTPGENVHLALHPDTMHFFDAATGKRRDDVAVNAARDANNSVQNVLV
jgi:hypothetical protein